jgi:hypothetical protein
MTYKSGSTIIPNSDKRLLDIFVLLALLIRVSILGAVGVLGVVTSERMIGGGMASPLLWIENPKKLLLDMSNTKSIAEATPSRIVHFFQWIGVGSFVEGVIAGSVISSAWTPNLYSNTPILFVTRG